jgi:excinuclease UvrABC helicase subunit UvrB
MKIIGLTGKPYGENKFIMEVPEEEAYKLIGHSSYSHQGKKLEVGDTIKVSEMYDRLTSIKYNEAQLEKSAALLRASADLLDKALPAVHRANKKEKDTEEDK